MGDEKKSGIEEWGERKKRSTHLKCVREFANPSMNILVIVTKEL